MKNTQSTFNTTIDFGNTNSFSTIPETLITSTREADFIPNPDYSCRCRRGYSLSSDPFNPWKLQETPEDCSRGQIAKAYRLPRGAFY